MGSQFRTVPGMAEKCSCIFGISAILGGQALARAPMDGFTACPELTSHSRRWTSFTKDITHPYNISSL